MVFYFCCFNYHWSLFLHDNIELVIVFILENFDFNKLILYPVPLQLIPLFKIVFFIFKICLLILFLAAVGLSLLSLIEASRGYSLLCCMDFFSQAGDQIHVSCIGNQIPIHCATREVQFFPFKTFFNNERSYHIYRKFLKTYMFNLTYRYKINTFATVT